MFEILTQSPLFHGLTADRIEQLFTTASFSVESYTAGQVIAHRDTAYSGLMIILEGTVRGEVGSSKRRRIIDCIPAAQPIAPAFLFGGYNRLPMDIIANESTSVLTLHRGTIFEMMQEDTVVLSNFIEIISNRANYFSRRIYALSVLMVTEKVAALILEAAGHDGHVAVVDIDGMAHELDVTRTTIEQSISELAKRHYVSQLSDNRIEILNRHALHIKD